MKRQAIKLNRGPYDRGIQHNRQVKKTTKAVSRRFRRQTKEALRKGAEPPITATGGERY